MQPVQLCQRSIREDNSGGQSIVLNVIKQASPTTHFSIYPDFKTWQAGVCGAFQIFFGLASVIFEGVKYKYMCNYKYNNYEYDRYYLDYYEELCFRSDLGYAFFTPVTWLTSGGFLMAAACSKEIWKITTSLVLNIISALTSLYFIPLAAVYLHEVKGNNELEIAMGACILVVGVLQGLVSVRSAMLCYRTMRSIRSNIQRSEIDSSEIVRYVIGADVVDRVITPAANPGNRTVSVQVEAGTVQGVTQHGNSNSPPAYNTLFSGPGVVTSNN